MKMDDFEKWKKSNLFGLINLVLGDHDPHYNHYEDFAEVIWKESAICKQKHIINLFEKIQQEGRNPNLSKVIEIIEKGE